MNSNQQLEEKLNAYSHGIGAALAIVGSFYLLRPAMNNTLFLGILIYIASLLLLFVASTCYHATSHPRKKAKLRILDHISIYFLIAGTYTPVCLSLLQSSKGYLLLGLVWGIAIIGTVLKLFFTGKYETISLLLYGFMGWLVIIDGSALVDFATTAQLVALALGGMFYTVGILFYAIRKIPFNHFIWHLFVLAGAMCHWWMVYSLS
ncbi:Channel protein, hemolysin III family [Croceitalea dokdonensis DOKDO 023]|uniref:Channel protein, hemolysin III family n=1 Tax=Croceitalea dokdonensis DOKDO 023 TaxID=1300341 RepID=A0A0P7A508_9FLAO|nr:hemolysin III family protein [Croceitalea dokdonensis]KPM31543.1 Channel protein, hemolysin III family [Croceitalea dokdonensis DOKDO 023]